MYFVAQVPRVGMPLHIAPPTRRMSSLHVHVPASANSTYFFVIPRVREHGGPGGTAAAAGGIDDVASI